MAQMTTAYHAPGLRAKRSFMNRIDAPQIVVLAAAASMIFIVALLLAFIAWQGIQLFV